MSLIFFDTETTGNEADDRIIQLAYWRKDKDGGQVFEKMYKPPLPIKIAAMATHHITNEDVEHKLAFDAQEEYADIKSLFEDKHNIAIAHNARFDVGMMAKEGIDVKNIICTMRVAKHLDPEGVIQSYALQYLRYLLGIKVEGEAHDAMGDVNVLIKLFDRLFAKMKTTLEPDIPFLTDEDVLKHMVIVSNNPVKLVRLAFGKHKGKKFVDVLKDDRSYLEWLLGSESNKDNGGDEDLVYTLKELLYKPI